METKNKYSLPIKKGKFKKIDRTNSPAHVGKLKHSIDFMCKEGTEVLATLEGIVTWVKDDSNKGGSDKKYWNDGNRIEIKHNNSEYTAYEHLRYKGIEVNVGDRVKTGQLIGYSGKTGYTFTFGAHLHFEVFCFTSPNEEDFETLKVEFQNHKEIPSQ